MNILVLVKEVPDMEKVKFDQEKGVVDRSSAEAEINPFDENALQAAVDQKEKEQKNVTVTVMTMGPQRAEKTLRDAYARGADKGVLLTDRKFGGSDTCATAKTLAAAIRKIGNFDLILCGEKSVDGDTAQVGAEVAEFLDIPHAYYVEEIRNLDHDSVQVTIENIGGDRQVRTMKLPALIGVTKNISRPKLPTVNRKLESLTIQVETITLQDLNGFMSEEECGFKGSPTKVSKIEIPKEVKKNNQVFREDFTAFLQSVTDVLTEKGIV
ncbi:electron transfer flavoprotein subunit beta/FixA family protein [Anaerovorax sp. IOR16]|uniref:electron transfer flavoprotein subunit beta/FixA family protein n=1 Tax=Anaerovorax sp. IOR16 TaxID=2773458 RepID=UPI0019D0D959|nr:electron transfer flavoprotein subunit beta/FixA family protein [Anaerovorax sp. IOR16]